MSRGQNIQIAGTGYVRPEVRLMKDQDFEEFLKRGIAAKLTNNLYADNKSHWLKHSLGRGAKMQVAKFLRTIYWKDKESRSKGGWHWIHVPVDKDGHIPELIMAERIMDVESGDRGGAIRNVMVDLGIDADTKYDAHEAGAYRWYIYPNESDIKYLDDAKSKLIEILKKGEKGKARKMVVMGGTETQRRELAKSLMDNFTVAERKVLAGTIVQIEPIRGSAAGMFVLPLNKEAIPRIIIDPRYATDKKDVIVHEAVHALRNQDPNRIGALKMPTRLGGRDRDLEESLTEAETVIRQKPFTKPQTEAGYYQFLKDQLREGKTEAELEKEDRITGTEPPRGKPPLESPKRGKRAQKKVIKNYPSMNIRRLKLHGDVEAVDTFHKVEKAGDAVIVQAYNPTAAPASAHRLSLRLKDAGEKVTEYRDGRPHVIKARAPSRPKTGPRQPKGRGIMTRRGRLIRQKSRSVI